MVGSVGEMRGEEGRGEEGRGGESMGGQRRGEGNADTIERAII